MATRTDSFLATRALITKFLGPILAGNDPFDRELVWQQLWAVKLPENVCSVLDLALWDLAGRVTGLPVHELLGRGARRSRRMPAASTTSALPRQISRGTRSRAGTSDITPTRFILTSLSIR